MQIELSNDAFGEAIKEAMEHLQEHHASGSFGYADMPTWSDDKARAIGEPASKWVNSRILRDTNEAGLTETVGYEEFQLTEKGREATFAIDIRPSHQPGY
jgi:hypothetical protein